MAAFDYATTVTDAEKKYDIPDGIYERVLAKGERSGATATSPAGAYGYAQLMPAAAQDMGVNRYDPTQNIMGGAHYLRTLYDRFGNWDEAVAHYNAGPGGNVNNRETRDYFKRVQGHDMPDSMTGGSAPSAPQLVDPRLQAEIDGKITKGFDQAYAEAQQGDKDFGGFLKQYGAATDRLTGEYDALIHNPVPPIPRPPKLDEAPNANDYMHNPVSVLQQTLPAMAVFAGALTRRHAIGAMKAMAAAMKAQTTNDKEGFERAHQKWKDDTEQTLTQYGLMREEYQDIMESRDKSLQERLGELQGWAAKYQVAQASQMIASGDLGRLHDLMEFNTANAYRAYQVQNEAWRNEYEAQRMHEQERHNRSMESVAGGPQEAAFRAHVAQLESDLRQQHPEWTDDQVQSEAETEAFRRTSEDKKGNFDASEGRSWQKLIQANPEVRAFETQQQYFGSIDNIEEKLKANPALINSQAVQKELLEAFTRISANQAARKFLIDTGHEGPMNDAQRLFEKITSTNAPVMSAAVARQYLDMAKGMVPHAQDAYDSQLAQYATVMDQDGETPTLGMTRAAVDRLRSKGLYTPSPQIQALLDQGAGTQGGAYNAAPDPGTAPKYAPGPSGKPSAPVAAGFKHTVPPDKVKEFNALPANKKKAARDYMAGLGYDVSGLKV